MILYIVRHGIAVPHGTPGVAEDDRPLTEDGVKKLQKAAAGLKRLGVAPEVLLSSTLPRAMQTAQILRESFKRRPILRILDALAPAGNRAEIYRAIRMSKNVKEMMLVGHQPSLGEIAGEIAWGSAEHYVELKKGGVCALELENSGSSPRGTLFWLLTPAILRSIA